MVFLNIIDFLDTPELRRNISILSSAKQGETISIVLKNNLGGQTHMGGLLINEIKNSKANIILCLDGTVASTAAFVWSWIHLAKIHGLFSHVKTVINNEAAQLIFHRPRKIEDETRFIEDIPNSESSENLALYAERFDVAFKGLLDKYHSAKVYLLGREFEQLNHEYALKLYRSNKDVVICLGWTISLNLKA